MRAPVKELKCLSAMVFFSIGLAAAYTPPQTVREQDLLSGPWQFIQKATASSVAPYQPTYNDAGWSSVMVPHTWESKDTINTDTAAWYRIHFSLPTTDAGKRIYLFFEGVSVVSTVYLNGVKVGYHNGAYTRFIFDVTSQAVLGGDNVLAVKVNNDSNSCVNCLPATNLLQLYHLYGGIYRKVWILKTAAQHIDPTDYASPGIYLTPSAVSAASAQLSVQGLLRNTGSVATMMTFKAHLCDNQGNELAQWIDSANVPANGRGSVTVSGTLANPQLWGPSNPYLYTVYGEVWVGGQPVDVVGQTTGFRYYTLTNTTFTLNGQNTPLRGFDKHQETEFHANAVTDSELTQDFNNFTDIGVNYIRLPHYPHAKLEYDLADQRGILVWAENGHSNNGAGSATGDSITTEMVKQNFNHPCIVWWSAGNEAAGTTASIAAINRYAADIKALDPTRLITYASDGGYTLGPNVNFMAQNIYPGWYDGTDWDFESQAVADHFISETGAGGVLGTHYPYTDTIYTVGTFEPEEYQELVAEVRCQVLFRDDIGQIPVFTWWTFRDFGDVKYKGLNTKGVMTYNGGFKSSYYLFKSFLRPTVPVVYITSKAFFLRNGSLENGIKVYSNLANLTLTVNGVSKGTVANGAYKQWNNRVIANVFYWNAVLSPGANKILVSDGAGNSDSTTIYYVNAIGNAISEAASPVQNLTSSNVSNQAYFINRPVQTEYPFYYDFDGTADNTWIQIPPQLAGCGWIATRRASKAQNLTNLSFQIAPALDTATVYVIVTASASTSFLTQAGFTNTGVTGVWRDNNLYHQNYQLYQKQVVGGASVSLNGITADYVVLVRQGSYVPAALRGSRSLNMLKQGGAWYHDVSGRRVWQNSTSGPSNLTTPLVPR